MKTIQQEVCMLCNSSEVNELELGEFHSSGKISVHYFCLLLTSGLEQNGDDEQGIFGFLPKDIRAEVERIKRLKCAYCKKLKANVGCCDKKCRHTFHTNCALTHGCLMQFEDPYRSFCHQHVTQGTGTGRGARAARHKPTEMCTICYDQMGAYSDVDSVQSPCCKKSWFHRLCLMEFAKNAGYFFKCPMCNNEDDFRQAVKLRGVFVPDRDAAWELEPNAFAELLERPETCEAAECVCPQGRDHESSKYKMLRCVTCGSHCVHNKCLTTTGSGGQFTCASCDVVGPPAVAAMDEESDVDVESVRDIETDSVCEVDVQILSQSDENAAHGRSESDGEKNNDDTLRPPSKDDGLSTTVETDNESGVVCESDEQIMSQQSSGKGDNDNEPLGQSSADSDVTSKDDDANTTVEMDTTSDDDPVAAPVRTIDSNMSVNEVMIIETTKETIDISSDDDTEGGQGGVGQENVRRQPAPATTSSSSRQTKKVAVKRERSLEPERTDCVAPPQSKRIRRALETMKNQSKITSFFRALGAGVGQSAYHDPRTRTLGPLGSGSNVVRIKTERT